MGILLRGHETFPWVIGNVGIFTIAIFISYCVAARIIYKHEKNALKKSLKGDKKETKYDAITLKKACFYFVASAAVIIVTGVWLAYIGEELSVIFSLNESFVGSLFLGFVTTLPEITVSVAALLMGFREIAIANMLGSNLFNMTIIFVDDILYKKAPILKAVSPGHVTSAVVVMAMTAVVILAMVTGKGKKILRISWYVPVLFIIFLLGAYLNFIAR